MVIREMQPDALLIFTTAIKSACFGFLLVQGFRFGLARQFPLAGVFLLGKFLSFWIQFIAIGQFGPAHRSYYWIYYCTAVPVDLLALLILMRIYYLPYPPSLKRDWPLIAALPAFIGLSLTEPMFFGHRLSYVLFFCLTSVGALAAWRLFTCASQTIGSNLRGLLYGIFLPAALQGFNQALNYLGGSIWSYDSFRVVSELTNTGSWFIIAHGVRKLDPPRAGEDLARMDPEKGTEILKRYRRALWRWP